MVLAVALVIAGLLFVVATAFRAGWSERKSFHPKRHVPASPLGVAVIPAAWGDGVKGWYAKSRNGAAVVLCHGSGADRSQLNGELTLLSDAGFGALAFDWPGHGESGGRVALGEPERAAFRGAVDWLLRDGGIQPGRVGAYGTSIGAALAVQFASEDPRVAAVAAAGAFTDGLEQTAYEYRTSWPWSRAEALAVVRANVEGGNLRPIDVASKLRGRGGLFVTFEDDPVVPSAMSAQLAEAAGGEVYTVHGAGHGSYASAGGEAYAARLIAFFREHLGGTR